MNIATSYTTINLCRDYRNTSNMLVDPYQDLLSPCYHMQPLDMRVMSRCSERVFLNACEEKRSVLSTCALSLGYVNRLDTFDYYNTFERVDSWVDEQCVYMVSAVAKPAVEIVSC